MKIYSLKKDFFLLAVLVISGLIVGAGVMAGQHSDQVTGTVTVENITLSLNETSFAYGAMPANSASTTVPLFGGAGIVATNDGSLADFDILGADTGDWTLNTATSSADNYIHKFCNDTDDDCSTNPAWTNYTGLTTSAQALKASVAAAGTVAFQLSMHTPNPSTVFTQQSAAVTVQASAP